MAAARNIRPTRRDSDRDGDVMKMYGSWLKRGDDRRAIK